ncbi:MAG: ABC transporter ATP-binding protein [Solitalea-like symbiont of Tyrophagus putrescentiae]
MISIQNVHKSYSRTQILKGISFNIAKGAITSITGPSGAGKSTILNLIGTLDIIDEGKIVLNNTDISTLKHNKLSRFRNEHIGFVFQGYNLLPEFSALENVYIPALVSQTNKKQLNNRAKQLLDMVGLSHRLEHKPAQLSGGEQQRVAIARALINSPSVILADEPTGNLDSKNTEIIYKLFRDLCLEFNLTFVITTHNIYLAKKTDTIINMQDGAIVNQG